MSCQISFTGNLNFSQYGPCIWSINILHIRYHLCIICITELLTCTCFETLLLFHRVLNKDSECWSAVVVVDMMSHPNWKLLLLGWKQVSEERGKCYTQVGFLSVKNHHFHLTLDLSFSRVFFHKKSLQSSYHLFGSWLKSLIESLCFL